MTNVAAIEVVQIPADLLRFLSRHSHNARQITAFDLSIFHFLKLRELYKFLNNSMAARLSSSNYILV